MGHLVVGQVFPPAVVLDRELRVVDAQQMEQRGMEIVEPHGAVDGVVAELVDISAAHLAGNEPYPSEGGLVPVPAALTIVWVQPYYRPLSNRAPH